MCAEMLGMNLTPDASQMAEVWHPAARRPVATVAKAAGALPLSRASRLPHTSKSRTLACGTPCASWWRKPHAYTHTSGLAAASPLGVAAAEGGHLASPPLLPSRSDQTSVRQTKRPASFRALLRKLLRPTLQPAAFQHRRACRRTRQTQGRRPRAATSTTLLPPPPGLRRRRHLRRWSFGSRWVGCLGWLAGDCLLFCSSCGHLSQQGCPQGVPPRLCCCRRRPSSRRHAKP